MDATGWFTGNSRHRTCSRRQSGTGHQPSRKRCHPIGGLIVEILGEQPEGTLCLSMNGFHLEVLSLKNGWIRRLQSRKIS